MNYSYIKTAKYVTPGKIFCQFEDGKSGMIDLSKYIALGGVFDCLLDEQTAATIEVVDGVLTWNNGTVDIAPETVYHNATGYPLPSWIDKSAAI